jgi:regulator of replication initiation timing
MSETNDFFRELKALAQDFQGLREDNARLLTENERLQADLQRARAALDLNGAAVQPHLMDRLAEQKKDLDIAKAQLAGARHLVKALKDKLDTTRKTMNEMAGIGIECGCGEESCTLDADNLAEAKRLIHRLQAENEALRKQASSPNEQP